MSDKKCNDYRSFKNDLLLKHETEIIDRWTKTNIINNIDDPHIVNCLSTLLENQKLWSEKNIELLKQYSPILCLLCIIRECFNKDFIGYDLVSIQPAHSPAGNISYFKNEKMNEVQFKVSTRLRKTAWNPPISTPLKNNQYIFEYKGKSYLYGLDAECEAIKDCSINLKNEIIREIISDLTTNSGFIVTQKYDNPEQIIKLLNDLSFNIGSKTPKKEATWVVLSPHMVHLLSDEIEFNKEYKIQINKSDYIRKIGVLNKKWNVIEDSSYSPEKILMGLKGLKDDHRSHFFSGYFYIPYIMLSLTKDSLCSKPIFSSYSKKLIDAQFYGLINLENLAGCY